MPKTNTKAAEADQKNGAKAAKQPQDASPLLQWMRETAGPPVDLHELRRRLAKISGSMADDLAHEREDRF